MKNKRQWKAYWRNNISWETEFLLAFIGGYAAAIIIYTIITVITKLYLQ